MPVLCIEWDLSCFHSTVQSGMPHSSANMLCCSASAEYISSYFVPVGSMLDVLYRWHVHADERDCKSLTVMAASMARYTCGSALVPGKHHDVRLQAHTLSSHLI